MCLEMGVVAVFKESALVCICAWILVRCRNDKMAREAGKDGRLYLYASDVGGARLWSTKPGYAGYDRRTCAMTCTMIGMLSRLRPNRL